MAKLSKKQIKMRQAQSKLNSLTNASCAKTLLNTLTNNSFFSATVGLVITRTLNHLKENGFDNSRSFAFDVESFCIESQNKLISIYGENFETPTLEQVGMVAFQILDNCNLAKGISAPLMPKLVNGRLLNLSSISHDNVEITEQGEEFLNNTRSALNLFADENYFAQFFVNLSRAYAQKIVDKYQE